MTKVQRNNLVETYINDGFAVASALAVDYGVSPRHIAKLLRSRGIPNNSPRGRAVAMPTDPRWQRAIQVGQVIA